MRIYSEQNQLAIGAHGGAGENFAKNTIAAFSEAYRQGADFVEADIVLTRENIPICFHPKSLSSSKQPWIDVDDVSIEQVITYNQGNSDFTKFTDLMAWCEPLDKFFILIDFKNNANQDISQIIQIVKQYSMLERAIIMSSHANILKKSHLLDSRINICLLANSFNQVALDELVYEPFINGFTMDMKHLKSRFVSQVHNKRKFLFTSSEADPFQLKEALSLRLDAVVTQTPALVRQEISKLLPKK